MQPREGDPVWWFRNRPCLIGRRAASPVEQLVAYDVSGSAPFPEVATLSRVIPLEVQRRDLGRPLGAGEVVLDAGLGEQAIASFERQGLFARTGASVVVDGVAQPVARVAEGLTTVSSEGVQA